MRNKKMSLPISFSVNNEVSNKKDRFINVTIDVLHTGENYNRCVFSKEVVNENIETIKNTPILGFIQETSFREKDFKGHEYIITREDGKEKRKYIGHAYGMIPESCNPRWITKFCDDGQEREFLQVDGLLWTKFEDSTNIMLNNFEKPHSMELFPDNIEGYEDEQGLFHFTEFSFDGCCILGETDGIQPAMTNSKISVNFTMDDLVQNIQSELSNKYKVFTKIVNQSIADDESVKDTFTEDEKMVNEKNNQGGMESMQDTEAAKEIIEAEVVIGEVVEEVAEEQPVEEVIEEQQVEEVVEEATEEIVDEVVEEQPVQEQPVEEQFAIIADVVKQAEIVQDRWGNDVSRYSLQSVEEGEVIVVDRTDYQFYGFPFTIGEEVNVDFSCGNKKIVQYVNCETEAEVSECGFNFAAHIANIEEIAFTRLEEANKIAKEFEVKLAELQAEYEEIKPKYDEFVAAEQARIEAELEMQKDAELSKYEAVLAGDMEFEELKAQKAELTFAEIESKCALLYARKNLAKSSNFSKVEDSVAMTAGIVSQADDNYVFSSRYGAIPVKR